MTSPDNRWTLLAAATHAASAVLHSLVEGRKPPSQDPALHERVALLERRMDEVEREKKEKK